MRCQAGPEDGDVEHATAKRPHGSPVHIAGVEQLFLLDGASHDVDDQLLTRVGLEVARFVPCPVLVGAFGQLVLRPLVADALSISILAEGSVAGACWDAIEEARAYLRETVATARPGERKPAAGSAEESQRAGVLASLRSPGMTIAECIRALAASSDDPYVAAARASIQGSDDLQIDAETVTSPSDAGAWVLAWLWVGDGRTGVVPHSAMLEEVLSCARRALGGASGLDAEVRRQLENQAAWLEDLLANYAEEIDAIDSERPRSEPGAILWVDGKGRDMLFKPSDALRKLCELAKLAGMDISHSEHCEWFCSKYGDTLDAVVSVVRLG